MSSSSFHADLVSMKERRICLLNGYEIGDKFLGDGLDGRVYLARATPAKVQRTEKLKLLAKKGKSLQVAIKVIYADRGVKPILHLSRNLPNEISIMNMSFGHSNVVTLLDVFVSSKRIFLVMEYAAKGTLTDELYAFIQKNSAPFMEEDQARPYFQAIIKGLQYLHSHNIAHRDMKLENILIFKNGEVKIADFGFSTFLPNITPDAPMCGTASFMAPEQFEKTGTYDATVSDMWSAGMILFNMLHDHEPFSSATISEEVYQQNKLGKSTLLYRHSLTSECRHLLMGLLEPDPRKRISATSALEHPWLRQECITTNMCLQRKLPEEDVETVLMNPLYRFQEEYVRSYLHQRALLLSDLQTRITSVKSFPQMVFAETGLEIFLPRADTDGMSISEVWRLQAVKDPGESRPATQDIWECPDPGTGLMWKWISKDDNDCVNYSPVRRVVTESPLLEQWQVCWKQKLMERNTQDINTVGLYSNESWSMPDESFSSSRRRSNSVKLSVNGKVQPGNEAKSKHGDELPGEQPNPLVREVLVVVASPLLAKKTKKNTLRFSKRRGLFRFWKKKKETRTDRNPRFNEKTTVTAKRVGAVDVWKSEFPKQHTAANVDVTTSVKGSREAAKPLTRNTVFQWLRKKFFGTKVSPQNIARSKRDHKSKDVKKIFTSSDHQFCHSANEMTQKSSTTVTSFHRKGEDSYLFDVLSPTWQNAAPESGDRAVAADARHKSTKAKAGLMCNIKTKITCPAEPDSLLAFVEQFMPDDDMASKRLPAAPDNRSVEVMADTILNDVELPPTISIPAIVVTKADNDPISPPMLEFDGDRISISSDITKLAEWMLEKVIATQHELIAAENSCHQANQEVTTAASEQ